MKQERAKREAAGKRANRTVFWRTVFLMFVFGVALFVPLFVQLYRLQIVQHDELQQRAIDQQTLDQSVSAARGTIYDRNGNVLALSATVYNVILSPRDLDAVQEKYQKSAAKLKEGESMGYDEPTDERVSAGLSEILGVDLEEILKRCQKENSYYEIVAKGVEGDTEQAVRDFITENHLSNSVYLQPSTKRYYPYSDLAAQVIGFVNDNGGAYGLESKYEEMLKGEAGRIVTAKSAKGVELPNFFEDYLDAVNGYNVVTTIDTTIQNLVEKELEKRIAMYDVQNGGFCIVMDPNTGAVLAMASSPDYDLNNYSAVMDQVLQQTLAGLDTGSEEYSSALGSARLKQWSNKALNTSYEPGSTFKSIVLAAALEEGVTSLNDSFNCTGQIMVDKWPIRCSNRSGHGHQDLAKAVGNSCNPAFITIGQRLGADKFYDYLEDFGFTEVTGIDLPGEQAPAIKDGGTLWPRSSFNITQLATASFGQRFQTTPIQLITAVAATVNGGYLYTPYVVQSITDDEGNVIQETQPNVVRQVISEETSAQVARILENVVDGCITGTGLTGKNAYAAGYRIGGKTGSSQTLVDDETIVSFVGFAPADDPQVIILFALDSPKVTAPGSDYCTTGTYISGGAMAAPAVGEVLPDILDYLGVERVYQSAEMTDTTVPQLVGGTLSNAETALKKKNLSYRAVGDGNSITGQIPASGATVPSGSEVIIYLGAEKPTDTVKVPKLTGLTMSAAQATLSELDLYLKPTGANSYSSDSTRVSGQSLAEGVEVERGTVITVQFSDSYVGDNDADSASGMPAN